MSSTNPFTTDSEEEREGPRPGPVSRLFGVTSRQVTLTSPGRRGPGAIEYRGARGCSSLKIGVKAFKTWLQTWKNHFSVNSKILEIQIWGKNT